MRCIDARRRGRIRRIVIFTAAMELLSFIAAIPEAGESISAEEVLRGAISNPEKMAILRGIYAASQRFATVDIQARYEAFSRSSEPQRDDGGIPASPLDFLGSPDVKRRNITRLIWKSDGINRVFWERRVDDEPLPVTGEETYEFFGPNCTISWNLDYNEGIAADDGTPASIVRIRRIAAPDNMDTLDNFLKMLWPNFLYKSIMFSGDHFDIARANGRVAYAITHSRGYSKFVLDADYYPLYFNRVSDGFIVEETFFWITPNIRPRTEKR